MDRPTTGEILHFPDYPQGPRFVRPMDRSLAARLTGEPQEMIDLYGQLEAQRRPWPYDKDYGDIPPGVAAAEMLVEFFRERGDLFVAVCAGAALGMLCTVGLAFVWRLFI